MSPTAVADAQYRDVPGRRPHSVSIVVAVKNGLPWLRPQLASLVKQEAPVPLEIIVADNGSSDGTARLVQEFAEQSPRLRYLDAGSCRGQRDAQRLAVEHSTGELLLFADADDICPPGWAAAMMSAASSCHLVAGAVDVEALNDDDAINARPYARTTGVTAPAQSLHAGPYAIGANFAVWREVWLSVDDPSSDLPPSCIGGGEDRDFSYAVRQRGYVLGFCPHPPVQYRLREPGPKLRRQLRSYGIADAALVKRYGSLGARGDSVLSALRKYLFLVPRAAKARLEGDEAHWARSELAVALGRLEGSLRYRVLCL